ncbi:pyridoxine 5'-phosphate oxidase C-terminal domain-containing protein [Microbacterium testaceum]|uniref:pyridoxine 5'-phosphate oxidase C-terminal domain-containing protein n=1 Tax=Microbacterium testaceum TaxID=2033 RepID=UPI003593F262
MRLRADTVSCSSRSERTDRRARATTIAIEFWQGRPLRLLDRIVSVRDGDEWVGPRW